MPTHTPRRGVFIVMDGTDGSGKATQTHLLVERMQKENLPVRMMEFPQFGKKSCGPVEEYLNGKYGTSEEVGPYKASILYAVDRFDASFEIRQHLTKGMHIVSNRYVSSNMGHQACKIARRDERKKFLRWLYNLEYERFGIPKPDMNLILHVSVAIARKLLRKKSPRAYLYRRKRDIHEQDLEHMIRAEKTYLEIARTFSDFQLIECMSQHAILSPEEIHQKVWKVVSEYIHKTRKTHHP